MNNTQFEAGGHAPDPTALTELFTALDDFNRAEDAQQRLGESLVDGMIKGIHAERLEAEGMSAGEATEFVKITEGTRSAAEDAVALDHSAAGLVHSQTLKAFGLAICSDLTEPAHVIVDNGERLVAALASIDPSESTEAIRDGLGLMIDRFADPLPWTVINNHEEEVVALDLWPYWMHGGARPEPEQHATMLQTLKRGQDLAMLCEDLGVDPTKANKLRTITRYHDENMLVEWALASEMGFYDPSYGENAGGSLYRQWHDADGWQGFWRMLEFAQAKSMPGDTFVAELKSRVSANLTIFMRALMAGRLALDSQEQEGSWQDPSDFIKEIPEFPFMKDLLAIRDRLQPSGNETASAGESSRQSTRAHSLGELGCTISEAIGLLPQDSVLEAAAMISDRIAQLQELSARSPDQAETQPRIAALEQARLSLLQARDAIDHTKLSAAQLLDNWGIDLS